MKIKKGKLKWIIISALALVISLSATAFAAGLDDNAEAGDKIENNDNTEVNSVYEVYLEGEDEGYIYTGEAVKPEVADVTCDGVSLAKESYEVSYAEETEDAYVDSGEHKVFVTVKDEEGTEIIKIEKEFSIEKASLKDTKITLSKTKFTYNAKEQKPTVTVMLGDVKISAENYTVKYSNNKEVGTAKVTITGKGNLSGSVSKTFEIIVGKASVSTYPHYNKIKISWKKITGAHGYAVYWSTAENGTYKRIATIKNGNTLSYTKTGLTTGKTYYFKVRAYRTLKGKNIYGPASAAKKEQVKPERTAITKVTRKNPTSLAITWKKIAGAHGYQVYRSTEEKGTYTRIATLKGGSTLTYTDKNCTCGRTYYYKVRAYRTQSKKNYYAVSSPAFAQNAVPAKVTITDNTLCESTEITLKWKKVSYATGYVIYRSENKTDYTKVASISKADTLSWKNTGLEKGKVYYYKIRAYRKIDGKNVYGYWSDVFTKSSAGWKYKTYDGQKVKLYYNAKGQLVKDVSNLIGKQSSYVIKVNKQKCTVTVYAKDGNNGYIIPVKAFICSPGQATPIGTFYTPQKYRWHELMGPCWGQWCTRITGGILFHSVYYNSYNNNNALSVSAYNKLGTICSHGCVRLTAGDAKWIYDNCSLKTKVIIYNSSKEGPLGKPTAHKLSSWHTWDPTDPNLKSKCAKKGCH